MKYFGFMFYLINIKNLMSLTYQVKFFTMFLLFEINKISFFSKIPKTFLLRGDFPLFWKGGGPPNSDFADAGENGRKKSDIVHKSEGLVYLFLLSLG